MSEDVLFEVSGGVGRITLNRPRQINALTTAMLAAIGDLAIAGLLAVIATLATWRWRWPTKRALGFLARHAEPTVRLASKHSATMKVERSATRRFGLRIASSSSSAPPVSSSLISLSDSSRSLRLIEDMLDCMDVLRANHYHHPPSITGLQMEMIGWRKGMQEREKLKTRSGKPRKTGESRHKAKFFSSAAVVIGYEPHHVTVVAQRRGSSVKG